MPTTTPATQGWNPGPRDSRGGGVTDEETMARVQGGDREAFERLERGYRGGLRRYCWRRIGDEGLAADAYQEVWMRVYRGRAAFDPEGRFRAWFFRIAHNVCASANRRQAQDPTSASESGAASAGRAPEDAARDGTLPDPRRASYPGERLEAEELSMKVEGCIAGLPRPYRDVLDLWLADLSHAEIARVLDIPAGTSASRLYSAREKLRDCLGRNGIHLEGASDGTVADSPT